MGDFLLKIFIPKPPTKTPPVLFPLPCCLLLLSSSPPLLVRERERWPRCQKIPFFPHPVAYSSTENPTFPSKASIYLHISPIRKPTFPSTPYLSPTILSLYGIPTSLWTPPPALQLLQKGPLEDHLGPPGWRAWPDWRAGCDWRMGEILQTERKGFWCPAIAAFLLCQWGTIRRHTRGGCHLLRSHRGANFSLFTLPRKDIYWWKEAIWCPCPC